MTGERLVSALRRRGKLLQSRHDLSLDGVREAFRRSHQAAGKPPARLLLAGPLPHLPLYSRNKSVFNNISERKGEGAAGPVDPAAEQDSRWSVEPARRRRVGELADGVDAIQASDSRTEPAHGTRSRPGDRGAAQQTGRYGL